MFTIFLNTANLTDLPRSISGDVECLTDSEVIWGGDFCDEVVGAIIPV